MLVEHYQVCFLSSQITGFFDWHYQWKESTDILGFLHENISRGDMHMRLPLMVGWDQVCLLFNQIEGYFDDHYLWKKSIDTLVF